MNIVKELRQRAGMQQKELASLVGVSRPTISEWEHGKKDPSGERLRKLADLFNVDPGTILGFPADSPIHREDDDIAALREQYRRDPNTRLLFQAARKATPDHIRAAAAMLKSLEPEEFPDVD
jgi:transcriptional regulator with XRE-family HTH domain